MTLKTGITTALAAAAIAITGFTAAPARADGRDLFGLLAGVTAVAIIAGSVDGGGYYRERHDRRWGRGDGWGRGEGWGRGDGWGGRRMWRRGYDH